MAKNGMVAKFSLLHKVITRGSIMLVTDFLFLIYTHGWQPAVYITLLLIDDLTGERYSLSLGQNTFIVTVS